MLRLGDGESLTPIGGLEQTVSLVRQELDQDFPVHREVVNNQDGGHGLPSRGSRSPRDQFEWTKEVG